MRSTYYLLKAGRWSTK